jgi:hypothetical protein
MKRPGIIPKIRSDRKYLNHILLFVASALIVAAISPREGKFRYEYQKGKPWLSPSLIAPWDFPVQKPDQIISREQDSILKNFAPYFKVDPETARREISEFDSYLDTRKKSFESIREQIRQPIYATLKQDLDSVLGKVYDSGILDWNETDFKRDSSIGFITVVTGKIGEQRPLSSVLSQKSAYQFAENELESLKKHYLALNGKLLFDFLSDVAFYSYIKPNLLYDNEMSVSSREKMLNSISLNRGMIQKGELIISRGEIVNDTKYQMLDSLRNQYEKRLGINDKWLVLLGRIILVSSCYLGLYLFMFHFRLDVLNSTHKTLFIILLILAFLILTRLIILLPANTVFLVPFAIIPITVRTFYDSRLALFVYLIAIMLAGFIVPNSFEFVFISYIVGVIAIFSLTNIYKRSKLFITAFKVFLTYSIVYFGIGIMQEGSIQDMSWINYIWFAGNGVMLLLTYPLIFLFEKTFSFISDATLFELSDTNQPLLRKLAEEAPGSFQHSIQVANLSEAAAREIGANNLLARAGAFYHDIGKTVHPEFFIENQTGGYSPHDHLDPVESSKIIIDHVTEGLELSKRYNLPQQIVDFIRTHHGTSLAYFFYRKYLDSNPKGPDARMSFAYPGPKPFSKETAIVMMADAVEASSRTLTSHTDENISELVERIIYIQEQDGQFRNTPLTFKDISDIKNVLIRRLSNMYHARVTYPVR